MPLVEHDHVASPFRTAHSIISCKFFPVLQNFRCMTLASMLVLEPGTLFMLITRQKEMRKLNKTKGETENLVQELKQQRELNCEEIESHCVDSSDNTSCPSQRSFNTSCHGRSSHGIIEQPVSPKACKKDDFLDGHVSLTHGIDKDQMATLAAELEAELELMELNIKTEESRPFETCMHDGDEGSSKGISNSYYSDTSSHGMLDASDIGRPSAQSQASCNFSVSPIELDHRLRQLLEAQQQERILELEELLEETKSRLLVKEHEVLCWKNHVNSLTNLLQLHSSDTYVHRPQKLNGKDSVKLHDNHESEVNKNVDLFQLFQDATVSKQFHDVNVDLSIESVDDACIRKTASSHRFSDSDSFNVKHITNETSISASRKTRDVTKGAADSHFQEGFTGIDIPENAILKAMYTQTVGQNAEGYQNQVLVDTDIGDICREPENSRLPGLKREVDVRRGHAHDNEAVSAGNVAEIPESHPANCRVDFSKPTVCPKEESDQDTDVKYIVKSVMTRPLLLSKYQENSFDEAIQEPKVRMPSVTAKKCWRETHGKSVGVTSPVLDKIRHYEALGARVMEKRV